jgi:hypothetical protein
MKQMDTMLFQQSQTMDDIKNRLNCIESGSGSGFSEYNGLSESDSELSLEQIKPALMADTDFVSGIVDNIMNNSNLSEIIEQIDIVQTENRELRELLHAQQKTINEMNLMLLKLFSQSMNQSAPITQTVAPVPEVPKPDPEVPLVLEVPAPEVPKPDPEVPTRDEPEDPDTNNDNQIQLDVVESSNMQAVD